MDSAQSTASSGGAGPPLSHPKAAGLEAVVASAVREEFARHGGGGGGTSGGGGGGEIERKMSLLESRLDVIERTMVTGETLQRELGTVKTELGKVPFETVKWLFAMLGVIAAVTAAAYNIWFRT